MVCASAYVHVWVHVKKYWEEGIPPPREIWERKTLIDKARVRERERDQQQENWTREDLQKSLQHIATRCNTLQHIEGSEKHTSMDFSLHCNTLQHVAIRYSRLQHEETYSKKFTKMDRSLCFSLHWGCACMRVRMLVLGERGSRPKSKIESYGTYQNMYECTYMIILIHVYIYT